MDGRGSFVQRIALCTFLLGALPAAADGLWPAASVPSPQRLSVLTEDGVELAVRRYPRPGAQPVLLVHGLSANMNCFDLSVEGASLARYLSSRGFDVWLYNQRGMGTGEWASDEPAGWKHSVDDLALLDLAAAVELVLDETGMPLLAIGHSMGGMELTVYLLGTTYAEHAGTGASRVRLDPGLEAERQQKIAAAVLFASPVRLDWEARPNVLNFLFYSYWDHNLLLTTVAGSDLALAGAKALDFLPVSRLIVLLTGDLRDFPYVGGFLADFLIWVVSNVSDSFLLAQIFNPTHMTPQLIDRALVEVIDDTGGQVLVQFIDNVRGRTFREYHHARSPEPVVYANNFDRIRLPLLVATGGRDKLANDGTIYEHGFKRYGSADKQYVNFPTRGHGDILIGKGVEQEVFAPIGDWLLERSATGTVSVN
jgi:pimeloyl-ACP methyl ester carboxylesterase